jgi:hypothetical protein
MGFRIENTPRKRKTERQNRRFGIGVGVVDLRARVRARESRSGAALGDPAVDLVDPVLAGLVLEIAIAAPGVGGEQDHRDRGGADEVLKRLRHGRLLRFTSAAILPRRVPGSSGRIFGATGQGIRMPGALTREGVFPDRENEPFDSDTVVSFALFGEG